MPYQSYEEEKEEALYLESLSDGAFIDRQNHLEAQFFGDQKADSQWILTSYDTWVINPHYDGPDQEHPESY